jgi:hypothetical protein
VQAVRAAHVRHRCKATTRRRPAPFLDIVGRAALLHGLVPQTRAGIAARVAREASRFRRDDFPRRRASGRSPSRDAGLIRLAQAAAGGHAVVVRLVGRADPLAVVSLFEGSVYSVIPNAVGDRSPVLWPREVLRRIFEHHPFVAASAMGMVAERFHELQERVAELATVRVPRRSPYAARGVLGGGRDRVLITSPHALGARRGPPGEAASLSAGEV